MSTVAKTIAAIDLEELYNLEIAREEETLDISRTRFERNESTLNEHRRGGDSLTGRVVTNRLCEPFAEAIREFLDPADKSRGWNAGNKGALRDALKGLGLTDLELAFGTIKAVLHEYFRPERTGYASTVAGEITATLLVCAEYKEFKKLDAKEAKRMTDNVVRKKGTLNNRYGRSVLATARTLLNQPARLSFANGVRTQIGMKMLELFIESTGAFELKKIYAGVNDTPIILQAVDEFSELVKTCSEALAQLKPQYRVMLVPPNPWTTMFDGGYLLPLHSLHPSLVKHAPSVLVEAKRFPMPKVLEAVNRIQNTRWRINRPLAEVARQIWDMGGNRAGLCSCDEQPVPPKPWDDTLGEAAFREWKEANAEAYKSWSAAAQAVHKSNKHAGGDRIRVAYQLQMAEENAPFEAIYFPWTCDFRGRLYALPAYVNPQSNDLGKALLTFADAKPLGAAGVYWLRVHLANCAGVDKVSFGERIQWVLDHETEIRMSAEDPLANRWWEDRDAPFQFLAACMEYAGFLREGENYRSSLPIAMDGTCNGLQHLSAMLRDPKGGAATNLVPSALPADIYTEVLDVVRGLLEADSQQREDELTRLKAAAWLPHLKRSTTKRPVMTTPYGVSRFGITDQIMEQVYAERLFVGYALKASEFAQYLTTRIQQAIAQVITAAPAAMGWLQECARIITEADKSCRGISWTVPGSEFRVIQRYFAETRKEVNMFIGSQRIRVRTDEYDERRVSPRRQLSGIAPNVIHSLDASMLVLTVNALGAQGIRHFALVHDSYGCHACDIPVLHQALRQEFIRIYENSDVLRGLKESWEKSYGVALPEIPAQGTLNVSQVAHSKYFFA